MLRKPGHVPVLLGPAVDALNIRADGIYVDGTYGRGGHSEAILARLGKEGQLVVMDRDPQAIADAHARFDDDSRVTVCHDDFAALEPLTRRLGIFGRVNGVLLDVGVSSPQLDDPARGFSFSSDGPLDMRMDPGSGESAADWLARADQEEIARVIRDYGEERQARRIARRIVARRAERPITRTAELASLVAGAVKSGSRDIHPATRTFQALRIQVNEELSALERALEAAIDLLAVAGRLVVISFHSLEDRLVKQALVRASSPPPASRRLPVASAFRPRLRLVGRLLRPDPAEIESNPRARSARMRVAEKLPGAAS
ncbi:MAG: 16S rRNA (cytosine(1402)-N(4))-methyltransferase RsmH [Pseudomonadota bacterium]|nr:MAG: 16S rRNA (cytosine(1402)-N(4))-methyltransferase RsmH [Pseudomonadota bacterium]